MQIFYGARSVGGYREAKSHIPIRLIGTWPNQRTDAQGVSSRKIKKLIAFTTCDITQLLAYYFEDVIYARRNERTLEGPL
jgi:hypothetical protein